MDNLELEKEFKKLNYALESYKSCDYSAEYQIGNESTLMILKNNITGEDLLIHRYEGLVTIEDVSEFKKKALYMCTHDVK